MLIRLRDVDGEEIGTIKVKDGYSIAENECMNLTHTDTDSTDDGEIIYTLDFLESRPLQKICTREFLAEIERRIEEK